MTGSLAELRTPAPAPIVDELFRLAEKKGLTRGGIVLTAVVEYLERNRKDEYHGME